jgi:hypothetical protein
MNVECSIEHVHCHLLSTFMIEMANSRDDQAGEAGPVEQSSAEAKSLKLRAKGLSGCHPSGQQPRQPDGGAKGPK